MKKLLSSAAGCAILLASANAAFAADPFIYDPVVSRPDVVQFTWTGPYIGVFGGLSAGDRRFAFGPAGGPDSVHLDVSGSGFLGGAQIGYDWQMDNFVLGGVADIALSNYRSRLGFDVPPAPPPGLSGQAESKLDYMGTVRARAGFAMDRALFYGHGGFAWAHTSQNISIGGTTIHSGNTNRAGWTIGAGIEYAFTDNVSLQTEYSYVHFGSRNVYSDATFYANERLNFHTLKAAVNFRF